MVKWRCSQIASSDVCGKLHGTHDSTYVRHTLHTYACMPHTDWWQLVVVCLAASTIACDDMVVCFLMASDGVLWAVLLALWTNGG